MTVTTIDTKTRRMENLAVYPYGIRVWLGYRHSDLLNRRAEFIQKLGSIFIPQTVQQMGPLGLCAYFPLVLPDSDAKWPDEVALVVYPSPSVYETATKDSTAGRAYGALHGAYFNFSHSASVPPSRSSFPGIYGTELIMSHPYAVLGNQVDWHAGATSVLVMKRPPEWRDSDFLAKLNAVVSSLPSPETDEVIIQVETGFALIYEHVKDPESQPETLNQVIQAFPNAQIVRSQAQQIRVPEAFSTPDRGVSVAEGQLLDVRVA